MKNSHYSIFAFFLLLMFSCQKKTDEKVFFFAHALPVHHPIHKAALEFKKSLYQKSGGKLSIKIFPDSQLGTERETLELLQIGSVAISKVNSASMASFAPEYQILTIPYLFKDTEESFKTLEGPIGKSILKSGSDFLLRGLCFYDAGGRSFYTKKPIRTPEDLKGLKIRVMNDKMAVGLMNKLGASATPMAYGELYTALQQNVIDGAENNIPSFVGSNHHEVCKYYSFDDHAIIPDVVIMGTKFWDNLSDQEKIWVQESADESAVKQKEFWKETVAEYMEVMKKEGVEVIYPDKSLFKAKVEGMSEELEKDPKLKKIIDQIRAENE